MIAEGLRAARQGAVWIADREQAGCPNIAYANVSSAGTEQPRMLYFPFNPGRKTLDTFAEVARLKSGSGRPNWSRQPTSEQDEISLGKWQIQLGRAIREYLKISVPEAANSAVGKADAV